jgi:ATP-dependent DNA helicase DinG
VGLQSAVERVFDAGGPLSSLVANFQPRSGQVRMALEVARTIEGGGTLVAEAGTGVGKTYAYLVPALLSGHRVLLSTATKALQDQLFGRDIPRLLAALGLPTRVALLKGRASYLCMHRLSTARQDPRSQELSAMRQLARIEEWSVDTRSGDLAELAAVDEGSAVLGLVSSTRENCLGSQCPKVAQCHVNLARREAMAADLVVINHHLFFADLNVRESGVAELLPSAQMVIFDEAHQLSDIGVQFLGRQLTTGQLTGFGRDMAIHGPRWALGTANWHLLALDLDGAIKALRVLLVDTSAGGVRLGWDTTSPQGISMDHWTSAMGRLEAVMLEIAHTLALLGESSLDLSKLAQRGAELLHLLQSYARPCEKGYVRWVDVGQQVRLVESPLDIAVAMRTQIAAGEALGGTKKSWIFTSATLGTDSAMSWFVQTCGLDAAQILQVGSPFDYALQAALAVPQDMPKPSDSSHSKAVASLVAKGAGVLGGRTLVLTTTLRAMRTIGEHLFSHFEGPKNVEVLVQGQASKRELLERFCAAAAPGARGCVMVASASFWEGIDIAGEALQLLVIDKLPFSPPDDPLMEARSQQLKASGKNAFHSLHLPQATIALKQGVGRLIRSETDRGVLVICDVRLTQMGYGRKMLDSLPPMKRLSSEAQLFDALRSLTKLSTTGLPDQP